MSNYLLTGCKVYDNGVFRNADIAVCDGKIASVMPSISQEGFFVVELNDMLVVPGFVDVHVHLREPGFSYKETIASGTAAAAAGGYTAVCSMPNLDPVPDCRENLGKQLEIIERDAKVRVYPYGSITVGQNGAELSDMQAMASDVIAFSDDGKGVQDEDMMRKAMLKARSLKKMIVAHCEDESLLEGGVIHKGEYARENDIPGISSESEWRQIERDLELVRETGVRYHVCHISTKKSVKLIRKAKEEGLRVTCETAPHYLVLSDEDLQDDGRFKMNPPIRSMSDRVALIEGLCDGTIDVIATDHAPHSAQEKSKGLRGSLNGIVGLETAFPVLYTELVKTDMVSLETILNAMCWNPRRIFRIPGGSIAEGEIADLAVIDPGCSYTVEPESFVSMGKATPFAGFKVDAGIVMTMVGGEIVYDKDGRAQRGGENI